MPGRTGSTIHRAAYYVNLNWEASVLGLHRAETSVLPTSQKSKADIVFTALQVAACKARLLTDSWEEIWGLAVLLWLYVASSGKHKPNIL
jgi:hypothetical protein